MTRRSLGGVLTELAGWRWVFLVNASVGITVIVASLRACPLADPRHARAVSNETNIVTR